MTPLGGWLVAFGVVIPLLSAGVDGSTPVRAWHTFTSTEINACILVPKNQQVWIYWMLTISLPSLEKCVHEFTRALWGFTVCFTSGNINKVQTLSRTSKALQTGSLGCPNNDRLIWPFSTAFCLKPRHRLACGEPLCQHVAFHDGKKKKKKTLQCSTLKKINLNTLGVEKGFSWDQIVKAQWYKCQWQK